MVIIDKLDITFSVYGIEFLQFLFDYAKRKKISGIQGSGAKFFFQHSFLTSQFQLYYSVSEDKTIVTCYLSIGSKLSNAYHFRLLKKLINTYQVINLKIRRVDFAIDLFDDDALNFTISEFRIKSVPATSKPQISIIRNKTNHKYIDTAYLTTSNFKIRMYDKGVEQKISAFNSDWKRFEIQINSDFIDYYVNHTEINYNCISDLKSKFQSIISIVSRKYRFQEKYNVLLSVIANNKKPLRSVSKNKSDLEQTMSWFINQYEKYLRYYIVQNKFEIMKFILDEKRQEAFLSDFYDWFSNR